MVRRARSTIVYDAIRDSTRRTPYGREMNAVCRSESQRNSGEGFCNAGANACGVRTTMRRATNGKRRKRKCLPVRDFGGCVAVRVQLSRTLNEHEHCALVPQREPVTMDTKWKT